MMWFVPMNGESGHPGSDGVIWPKKFVTIET